MKMRILLTTLLLVGLLSLTNLGRAATLDDFGAKPFGMAGAFRALADDNGAMDYNPAGLAMQEFYNIEASYILSSPADADMFNISIADNTSNKYLAGGFAFTYGDLSERYYAKKRLMEMKLAFAQHFKRTLSWGLTGKLVSLTKGEKETAVDVGIPYIPDELFARTELDSSAEVNPRVRHIDLLLSETTGDATYEFGMDAGMMLKLGRYVALAFTGDNLIPTAIKELRRSIAGGAAFTFSDMLALDADLQWDLGDGPKYGAMSQYYGANVNLGKNLGVRGGYKRDGLGDSHAYAVGLGYTYATGGMLLGFQQSIDEPSNYTCYFSLNMGLASAMDDDLFKSKYHQ